jgi:hypothetical protein
MLLLLVAAETALSRVTSSNLETSFRVNAFGPILVAKALSPLLLAAAATQQRPALVVNMSARVSPPGCTLACWSAWRSARVRRSWGPTRRDVSAWPHGCDCGPFPGMHVAPGGPCRLCGPQGTLPMLPWQLFDVVRHGAMRASFMGNMRRSTSSLWGPMSMHTALESAHV